jgi:hypothetical protein
MVKGLTLTFARYEIFIDSGHVLGVACWRLPKVQQSGPHLLRTLIDRSNKDLAHFHVNEGSFFGPNASLPFELLTVSVSPISYCDTEADLEPGESVRN